MREIAVAIAASGMVLALAVALTGRWHVASHQAGAFTRTVFADAWTGTVQVGTTSAGQTFAEARTICASEVRP